MVWEEESVRTSRGRMRHQEGPEVVCVGRPPPSYRESMFYASRQMASFTTSPPRNSRHHQRNLSNHLYRRQNGVSSLSSKTYQYSRHVPHGYGPYLQHSGPSIYSTAFAHSQQSQQTHEPHTAPCAPRAPRPLSKYNPLLKYPSSIPFPNANESQGKYVQACNISQQYNTQQTKLHEHYKHPHSGAENSHAVRQQPADFVSNKNMEDVLHAECLSKLHNENMKSMNDVQTNDVYDVEKQLVGREITTLRIVDNIAPRPRINVQSRYCEAEAVKYAAFENGYDTTSVCKDGGVTNQQQIIESYNTHKGLQSARNEGTARIEPSPAVPESKSQHRRQHYSLGKFARMLEDDADLPLFSVPFKKRPHLSCSREQSADRRCTPDSSGQIATESNYCLPAEAQNFEKENQNADLHTDSRNLMQSAGSPQSSSCSVTSAQGSCGIRESKNLEKTEYLPSCANMAGGSDLEALFPADVKAVTFTDTFLEASPTPTPPLCNVLPPLGVPQNNSTHVLQPIHVPPNNTVFKMSSSVPRPIHAPPSNSSGVPQHIQENNSSVQSVSPLSRNPVTTSSPAHSTVDYQISLNSPVRGISNFSTSVPQPPEPRTHRKLATHNTTPQHISDPRLYTNNVAAPRDITITQNGTNTTNAAYSNCDSTNPIPNISTGHLLQTRNSDPVITGVGASVIRSMRSANHSFPPTLHYPPILDSSSSLSKNNHAQQNESIRRNELHLDNGKPQHEMKPRNRGNEQSQQMQHVWKKESKVLFTIEACQAARFSIYISPETSLPCMVCGTNVKGESIIYHLIFSKIECSACHLTIKSCKEFESFDFFNTPCSCSADLRHSYLRWVTNPVQVLFHYALANMRKKTTSPHLQNILRKMAIYINIFSCLEVYYPWAEALQKSGKFVRRSLKSLNKHSQVAGDSSERGNGPNSPITNLNTTNLITLGGPDQCGDGTSRLNSSEDDISRNAETTDISQNHTVQSKSVNVESSSHESACCRVSEKFSNEMQTTTNTSEVIVRENSFIYDLATPPKHNEKSKPSHHEHSSTLVERQEGSDADNNKGLKFLVSEKHPSAVDVSTSFQRKNTSAEEMRLQSFEHQARGQHKETVSSGETDNPVEQISKLPHKLHEQSSPFNTGEPEGDKCLEEAGGGECLELEYGEMVLPHPYGQDMMEQEVQYLYVMNLADHDALVDIHNITTSDDQQVSLEINAEMEDISVNKLPQLKKIRRNILDSDNQHASFSENAQAVMAVPANSSSHNSSQPDNASQEYVAPHFKDDSTARTPDYDTDLNMYVDDQSAHELKDCTPIQKIQGESISCGEILANDKQTNANKRKTPKNKKKTFIKKHKKRKNRAMPLCRKKALGHPPHGESDWSAVNAQKTYYLMRSLSDENVETCVMCYTPLLQSCLTYNVVTTVVKVRCQGCGLRMYFK